MYLLAAAAAAVATQPAFHRGTLNALNVCGLNAVSLAWCAPLDALADNTRPPVRIAPWTSAQAVVDANPAGTRYVLEASQHRMASIVPEHGDVFDGEPGAVLSGAKILTGWMRDGGDWRVTGQAQHGIFSHSNEVYRVEFERCVYPHDLWINGLLQTHVSTRDALRVGAWCFDYVNDTIYIRDNPIGGVVGTSVTAHTFSGPATNVTIPGLVVESRSGQFFLWPDADRNWTQWRGFSPDAAGGCY